MCVCSAANENFMSCNVKSPPNDHKPMLTWHHPARHLFQFRVEARLNTCHDLGIFYGPKRTEITASLTGFSHWLRGSDGCLRQRYWEILLLTHGPWLLREQFTQCIDHWPFKLWRTHPFEDGFILRLAKPFPGFTSQSLLLQVEKFDDFSHVHHKPVFHCKQIVTKLSTNLSQESRNMIHLRGYRTRASMGCPTRMKLSSDTRLFPALMIPAGSLHVGPAARVTVVEQKWFPMIRFEIPTPLSYVFISWWIKETHTMSINVMYPSWWFSYKWKLCIAAQSLVVTSHAQADAHASNISSVRIPAKVFPW